MIEVYRRHSYHPAYQIDSTHYYVMITCDHETQFNKIDEEMQRCCVEALHTQVYKECIEFIEQYCPSSEVREDFIKKLRGQDCKVVEG